jgi:hypothetical protein
MSNLFLSDVSGSVALNPAGNFNAPVTPAKSTTPSYCNTTARV